MSGSVVSSADWLLYLPYATLGQSEGIVDHHDATAGSERRALAPRSLDVSPWKCAQLLKALNLDHRQIVEAALIRAEAIGRTEPHPEVAMENQAERFPTVVASHGFNMRQTSSLALHLGSPFPRLRKTNAKTFGGFPTTLASGPHRHSVQIHTGHQGSASAGMERFRIA
jgi:hypothetical protein